MGLFAPGDHPGARSPARQVDQVGDLGHLAGRTLSVPSADMVACQRFFGIVHHHGGQLGTELVAHDEADVLAPSRRR